LPEIQVIIVDDHAILRDGIRSLLDRQPDITVIAEASNGLEALETVRRHQPDIVLMDVAMPVMNGLDATRLIKTEFPNVRVLILTQHDNREYVTPLLQAGASGYVLKRSGGREVVSAIRQVYHQNAYLEASITRQVLDEVLRSTEEQDILQRLTEREMEVLKHLIAGKTNKEIGLLLGISPKTVSVHRSNLMSKLDLRTSVELLRFADEHHLIDMTHLFE